MRQDRMCRYLQQSRNGGLLFPSDIVGVIVSALNRHKCVIVARRMKKLGVDQPSRLMLGRGLTTKDTKGTLRFTKGEAGYACHSESAAGVRRTPIGFALQLLVTTESLPSPFARSYICNRKLSNAFCFVE